MIIPLGADRPLRRPTPLTPALVVLNVAVFIAMTLGVTEHPEGDVTGPLASTFQSMILSPRDPAWWQFLTYSLLHAGPLHLLGNMLFLWTFGRAVEDRLGPLGFLAFYAVGVAVAGATHALTSPAPVIGASGGVAAVTGAYLVLFPRTIIRCFAFFFVVGIVEIPAIWFIAASIVWDIARSAGGGSGVAWAAHLGGYAFGAGVSLALLGLRVLGREPYDLLAVLERSKRKRDFRAVVASGASPWEGRPTRRAGKRGAAAEPEPDPEVLRLRAEVATAVSDARAADAAAGYRALLDRDSRAVFARATQIDLANRLYALGERELAGKAYDGFLDRYPQDPEATRVRLMLGMIHARELNDPIRAKALLRQARDAATAASERVLADELLAELG